MKNLTFIVVTLFLLQSATAQSDSCKVLLEKIAGNYTGKCQNGLANGKGKSIGDDTYIGNFANGLPEGKGKYLFKNGDVFNGYWKNGYKDGIGRLDYTLNGIKYTLTGFWKKDEYVGVTDPDISYRVTSASGIMDYKVIKKESVDKYDNEIIFSIKSAFTDFAPKDLIVEKSSGNFTQYGKKFRIDQYFCPLHIEISYTILVGEMRKQCRFIIDILEKGKYTITISND